MEDRRKFIRFDVVFDAFQLHDVFGNPPERVKSRIKNLSREGLRLFSENFLPKGSSIELELRIPGEDTPVFTFSEVVWSKPLSEGSSYDAGMRFTRIKNDDRARLLDYAYNEWMNLNK